MSRAALRWVAPLAWAAVLLWLGQQNGDDLPDSALWQLPGGDKLAHACAYALLGALTAWAAGLPGMPRAVGWGLAAALVVGLLDEWGQASTPDRQASLADVAADLVGGALGAGLATRFGPRLIPRRKG